MKNIIPIAAFVGAGALLINYLKRKARAGENLQFELLDVAIDSERTKKARFLKIFYDVKLNLINNENASINVRNVNLNITANGKNIGQINQTINFVVPQQSRKTIAFEIPFFTLGIIGLVMDLVQNGLRVNVNVSGYIDTDLGRVNVDFNKTVGAGINGPSQKKNSF